MQCFIVIMAAESKEWSANLKDTNNAKRGVKEMRKKAHDFELIILEATVNIKVVTARQLEEALFHFKTS